MLSLLSDSHNSRPLSALYLWRFWTVGFGMGAFISLMSSSFAYEDPLIRQQQQATGAISTTAKAREIFGEMGRGMWRSGKGFAKVTVLFAGTECVIESVSFSPSPRREPSEADS